MVSVALALLIMSAMTPAERAEIGRLTVSNYPRAALQNEIEGTSFFQVTVSPEGKPENCIVLETTGSTAFGAASCLSHLKKAKFRPARDQDGNQIAGTYKAREYWSIPDSARRPQERFPIVDFTVPSDQLPNTQSPTSVRVVLLVGTNGSIEACQRASDAEAEAVTSIACDIVTRSQRGLPGLDSSGKPVKSAQRATILMTASSSQKPGP